MTKFVSFRWLPLDSLTVCPALVLIRPASMHDAGLMAHELVHVGQMERDGWLRFVWRYFFSRAWRQTYEVAAYKVSLNHGAKIEIVADLLATKYRLRISVAEAEALLSAR